MTNQTTKPKETTQNGQETACSVSNDLLSGGIWVECEQHPKKKLPKWQRRSLWLPDDRVFLPAGVWMDETAAVLCASHDSTESMILDSEHVYLSSDWLANEFPKYRDDILAIAESIRENVKAR